MSFSVFDQGRLTGQATFPKPLSPSEPQPSSLHLESTFQLCFSSCTRSHMLCRFRYVNCSSLYALCVLLQSHLWHHTKKDPLSPWSFEKKLSAACKSELTHILLCFFGFFFSLSESFPFSVFWWSPAGLLWLKHELCVRMHWMSGGSLGK